MSESENKKVLIVQDNPLINKLLERELGSQGYCAVLTEYGLEGLSEAKKADFAFILLDYTLPDINGAEVCRRLRKDPRHEKAPIIFISAKEEHEITDEITKAGADGYMSPPFSGKSFAEKIQNMINKKNA